jgi:hypothetical protein
MPQCLRSCCSTKKGISSQIPFTTSIAKEQWRSLVLLFGHKSNIRTLHVLLNCVQFPLFLIETINSGINLISHFPYIIQQPSWPIICILSTVNYIPWFLWLHHLPLLLWPNIRSSCGLSSHTTMVCLPLFADLTFDSRRLAGVGFASTSEV